jgi:hypothetical protein
MKFRRRNSRSTFRGIARSKKSPEGSLCEDKTNPKKSHTEAESVIPAEHLYHLIVHTLKSKQKSSWNNEELLILIKQLYVELMILEKKLGDIENY